VPSAGERFFNRAGETVNHVLGKHDIIGNRFGSLSPHNVENQSRWAIHRKRECAMPAGSPYFGNVRDERIVCIEACKIVNFGTMILSRTASRPHDDAAKSVVPRRMPSGRWPVWYSSGSIIASVLRAVEPEE